MSSQVSYVTIHTVSVHLNTKVIENWSINSARPFSSLLNGASDLVENDTENTEVLKTFFISVFTSKTGLWESQGPGGGSRKNLDQGRPTLGGGGPSKVALKQTGHVEVHWGLTGCTHKS